MSEAAATFWTKYKKPIIIVVVVIIFIIIGYWLFAGESSPLSNFGSSSLAKYVPSERVRTIQATWGPVDNVPYKGYKDLIGENQWAVFAWNASDIVLGRDKSEAEKNEFSLKSNGNVLGFFKGYDMNPALTWGQFNNLGAEIKDYLATGGKHVDAVKVGEYLANA